MVQFNSHALSRSGLQLNAINTSVRFPSFLVPQELITAACMHVSTKSDTENMWLLFQAIKMSIFFFFLGGGGGASFQQTIIFNTPVLDYTHAVYNTSLDCM